jgi:hypothetical protein
MKSKHEKILDNDIYYCFVSLASEKSKVYVIPANQVAKAVTRSHKIWLDTPGKKGQSHNDSEMRWITNDYPFPVPGFKGGWMDKYLENWEQLD